MSVARISVSVARLSRLLPIWQNPCSKAKTLAAFANLAESLQQGYRPWAIGFCDQQTPLLVSAESLGQLFVVRHGATIKSLQDLAWTKSKTRAVS